MYVCMYILMYIYICIYICVQVDLWIRAPLPRERGGGGGVTLSGGVGVGIKAVLRRYLGVTLAKRERSGGGCHALRWCGCGY